MIELTVKEARARISKVLDQVESGEEIVIVRRGRRIARIVPERQNNLPLPCLAEFRAGIDATGEPLSTLVSQERDAR